MKLFAFIILVAIMAAALGFHNASALSIDTATATNSDGTSKFDDPDDKVPVAHANDDGQPSNHFQAQQVGNTGMSFGLTPSSNEPGAFERAQQRMQQ